MQLPDTLDVDENGYPSEDRLDEISKGDSCRCGGRWMVETFPRLAAEIPYGVCEVEDTCDEVFGNPVKVIRFSTQGWSGCESFIDAVLENTILRIVYHYEWRRGGHYVFQVTHAQMEAAP